VDDNSLLGADSNDSLLPEPHRRRTAASFNTNSVRARCIVSAYATSIIGCAILKLSADSDLIGKINKMGGDRRPTLFLYVER
jgi:hypothetical protein